MARRAFLRGAAALGAVAFAGPLRRARAASSVEFLWRIDARSAAPFATDRSGLVTIAPGGARGRDEALLDFGLRRAAEVAFAVVAHRGSGERDTSLRTVASETHRLGRGRHTLSWRPPAGTPAGTYVLRLAASDSDGRRIAYHETPPGRRPNRPAPVVRLLEIDAAFTQRSAPPGTAATLAVAADATSLTVQLLRCGAESEPTYANDELKGVPVGDPLTVDWQAQADGPATVAIQLGDWPSGLYCARVQSDDGRLGFAPLVLRPAAPLSRIAVVLPTSTWQAYNFYDLDGDGYGDSWYVAPTTTTIDLTRPHPNRGVPYRFRSYDLAFLRWLAARSDQVDFLADEDVDSFASGDELRAAHDLVVFPGHTEYTTAAAFDVVQRYRDLGGNLLFLSANNFFRHVEREGDRLRLVGLWRDEGRPEAALCGVQYRASDRGQRQAPFVVTGAELAPWAFDGTGLADGSTFGRFGIEIDATTADSPPGTAVLARIPDLLGPGRSAEMSYYEAPSGARVFSAGALNFGGEVSLWPETLRLLENVWARLTTR